MSELTKRLREESLRLMQRTFGDGCGSPSCAISASIADEAADRIDALEEIERLNAAWKAQQFHLEAEERESAHWKERAEKAERRAERLEGFLCAIFNKLDTYPPHAPGHCHSTPGIWDADNDSAIAGKRCEWCAKWSEIRGTLRADKGG